LGFFDKLKDGLARTKQQILGRFDEIVEKADTTEQRTRPVNVDTRQALAAPRSCELISLLPPPKRLDLRCPFNQDDRTRTMDNYRASGRSDFDDCATFARELSGTMRAPDTTE